MPEADLKTYEKSRAEGETIQLWSGSPKIKRMEGKDAFEGR